LSYLCRSYWQIPSDGKWSLALPQIAILQGLNNLGIDYAFSLSSPCRLPFLSLRKNPRTYTNGTCNCDARTLPVLDTPMPETYEAFHAAS